jgi:PilZ domain
VHLQEKIVAPVNETFEMRLKHLRAGVRLNSRVALAVEWTDAGRRLKAEGYTVDISPKGCLAVIPQGFAVGQRLRLVNLTNQNKCEALLVWRGHEGRTGWELGLELQDAPMDFWGVDF